MKNNFLFTKSSVGFEMLSVIKISKSCLVCSCSHFVQFAWQINHQAQTCVYRNSIVCNMKVGIFLPPSKVKHTITRKYNGMCSFEKRLETMALNTSLSIKYELHYIACYFRWSFFVVFLGRWQLAVIFSRFVKLGLVSNG